VQGYLIPTDGDGPFILAGGGVLIGETLYLNLSGTQKHTDQPNRDTGIMQVQLSKTTLNGTFYSIGRDFNLNDAGPTPYFDSRFQAGTLTLTGSIINLSSNLCYGDFDAPNGDGDVDGSDLVKFAADFGRTDCM